jgi:glycosyltransferase involved in cell wall biosynthesis
MIVSHAFSAEGPKPQTDYLEQNVDLRLVAPATFDDLFSPAREPTGPDDYLATYRRVPLSEWQFLLATPTMGIREFRPDVVHIDYDPWSAIFWQTRIITALFARGIPVISGAKKNTFRRLPGLIGLVKRRLARYGIRLTTRIEAASNMTAKMYQREFGVRPDRISVVTHIGVDTNLFEPCDRPPSDSDWLVVGYCGQFSEHKGVLTLFEATKLARSRGVRVRLEMLGKGPMRSALLELSRDSPWLTVRNSVLHDEVPGFMRGFDLYVLPAHVLPDHQEHDAHALLQALAAGSPAIGTRSGIIPEILGNGIGVLVEPSDVEELAIAIGDLAGDRDRRLRLARAGREAAVDRYSVEAVASLRLAEYLKVITTD